MLLLVAIFASLFSSLLIVIKPRPDVATGCYFRLFSILSDNVSIDSFDLLLSLNLIRLPRGGECDAQEFLFYR
jgi:hypothetical protein